MYIGIVQIQQVYINRNENVLHVIVYEVVYM